ncbi:Tryptophan aminotransferase-related protein 4, partial [Mucuna pruriens]
MARVHSLKYILSLTCSIALNLLLVSMFIRTRWQHNWTQEAAAEAEAVSSITCSGHGKAFLDGLLLHGKPVCECNMCYGASDCSQLLPDCMVDADSICTIACSGDPTFLEPFWMKNAGSSAIVVAGWHRMSYEFSDGSLISEELKAHIRNVHASVGNAITDGKYIIFGPGATHLLNAAVHALSSNASSSSPAKVVASIPYYPVYKEQTEFFKSEDYKFNGDTSMWKNDTSNSTFIELVTSPNNPDGHMKKAVLEGQFVKTIHDLAYYWPHFTPILEPADEDLMIFTLSKLTGHAGSRFGWAIIKDEAVYKRMLTYMDLSTYGVSRETQLRVLKLLKVVLSENGREMYEFGYNTMKNRWTRLSKALSRSNRFSTQNLKPQYCSFSQQIRTPSPAFAWLKCETSILEDRSCYEVLQAVNITGRPGSLFGADNRYVRLSLVRSEDDFDLLLRQINKLVSAEINHKRVTMVTLTGLIQGNESTLMLPAECCWNRSLDLRVELRALNSNIFPRQNGLYTEIVLSSDLKI